MALGAVLRIGRGVRAVSSKAPGRPFAIGVDACRTAMGRRRLTSELCATAGSAAAKSSTTTVSKSSVTLGLTRCASRPFDPFAAAPDCDELQKAAMSKRYLEDFAMGQIFGSRSPRIESEIKT